MPDAFSHGMKKVVFGVVDTPQQAELAMTRLEALGFSPGDVSVLYPDKHGAHDFQFERKTKAADGALAGIGFGAVIGGLLGIAVGVGVLTVPWLGSAVLDGPLLLGLAFAAAVGLVLALVGALVGSASPRIEAKYYAGKLRTGSILVAVHVARRAEARRVRDVLSTVAAVDVTSMPEAAVPVGAGT
jgi:hypothetical protein